MTVTLRQKASLLMMDKNVKHAFWQQTPDTQRVRKDVVQQTLTNLNRTEAGKKIKDTNNMANSHLMMYM